MAIDIRKPLKKVLPLLLKAQEENLNEADTIQRLIKVFVEVLGYDAMMEITAEKQIRDRYVDFAIRMDGVIRLLVEAKAAGITLRDRHIEQAERYAAEGNIRWVLLANGVMWNLYHLSFEEGIEYERVFSVDLTSNSIEQAAELLGLIHRRSIQSGQHETFWQRRAALSPESIGKALFTGEVLRFIRREIRKREGMLIDEEDLASAIHAMFSIETRERIGPARVLRKRKSRTAKRARKASVKAASVSTSDVPPTSREEEQGSER